MNTAQPDPDLEPFPDPQEELRLVEEDLELLRKEATELRERIGQRGDGPTDPEENAAMIERAEEAESQIELLQSRRQKLLRRLGAR